MNLLTLKPVDFSGPVNVKAPRNTSMKVVFKRGDMRILNMARETTGNARLAGFAIAWKECSGVDGSVAPLHRLF